MADMKDPARPQEFYMAGDLSANRVYPKVNSFTKLFESFEEFDKQVSKDINAMPEGDDKANARKMLDRSNFKLLQAARDLRTASRAEKLHDELTKKFSPTGNHDLIYEYTDADGNKKRWDPIQWVVEKKDLFGRNFNNIKLGESAAKNPQMNEVELKKRIQDHIALFNIDGDGGKGKGLMVYDPRYAGTNGRHQHVINVQNKVGGVYSGNC
ncbi:hypothetical protein K402DRAFT_391828, partial [Aulographum hederae CBS 113979]